MHSLAGADPPLSYLQSLLWGYFMFLPIKAGICIIDKMGYHKHAIHNVKPQQGPSHRWNVCVCSVARICAFIASLHLCETSKSSERCKVYDSSHHLLSLLDLQPCFPRAGEVRCLCPVSNCVLSGCGGKTEKPTSKQTPCLCLLWVCFSPHYLPFSFAPFSLWETPHLNAHLFPLPFSLPLIGLSSLSPVCSRPSSGPVVPGKSWLRCPRKTSPRAARKWRRRVSNSAHLLHSRHFGFLLSRIRLLLLHVLSEKWTEKENQHFFR